MPTKKIAICSRCKEEEEYEVRDNEAHMPTLWLRLLFLNAEHVKAQRIDLCPECSKNMVAALTTDNPFTVLPRAFDLEEVIHQAFIYIPDIVASYPDRTKDDWAHTSWFYETVVAFQDDEHLRMMFDAESEIDYLTAINVYEVVANEVARRVYGQMRGLEFVNWKDDAEEREAELKKDSEAKTGETQDDQAPNVVRAVRKVRDCISKHRKLITEVNETGTSTFMLRKMIEDLGFDYGTLLAEEDTRPRKAKAVNDRARSIRIMLNRPENKANKIEEIEEAIGIKITDVQYWRYVESVVESYMMADSGI